MTDEQLAAIKARLSAALPGPWTGMTIRRSLDGDCLAIVRQQENGGATIAATVVPTYSDRDTIPLFLHARADMDALVAEVDRLHAENRKLRDVLAWSECAPPRERALEAGEARRVFLDAVCFSEPYERAQLAIYARELLRDEGDL